MLHPTNQSTSEHVTTQRGINTQLIAALARFRELEDDYWQGKVSREEYLAASEEVRRLRAEPMKSLAPVMREKRFVELNEGR
jgi:hypothetical protein